MKKLYKFTEKDGMTYGGYKWPLPKKINGKWIPGEWTKPIEEKLEPCKNGYHLTDFDNLFEWMNEEMYEVEYKGELFHGNDKYIARQARLTRRVEKWNNKTLRLFSVWCARNAISLIDNPDSRSINAINVAEKFANEKATREELAAARDVAWSAARDVAWSAARDANWSAARAANWSAARAAAWSAARDANWSAAWSAAWAAAWSAARAAARDVAWSAARDAAWSAARAAAWSANWSADWAADWVAARDAQLKKLKKMLDL